MYEKNNFENRNFRGCPFEGEAGGPSVGRGSQQGHGGFGGGMLPDEILAEKPDAQILFVGAVNCLRHKPFFSMAEKMRAGKMSVLCPTMTDFATGRYLNQIRDAIAELAQERGAKEVALIFSCQWVILSTDGELLQQQAKEELGVELSLWDDSHLEHGDHA